MDGYDPYENCVTEKIVMATRGRKKKVVDGDSPIITDKREIDAVMREIKNKFGDKTIQKGSENIQPWRIPTNIFMLDLALLGGIPHNRWIMFHGPRSSGKTTAAEKCIAGAQASLPDQQCVFINIEGTRDPDWGEKLGVDNDKLLVVDPDTGENAIDIADAMIRTKEVSLVVVDSIAALAPSKEIEGSAEDAHVGLQARLMSAFTRKCNAALIAERKRGHYVTILVINQQRSKIGGWAPNGQEALSLPGGKALEFTTSVQVKFKNKESLSKNADGMDTLEYNEHTFTIDKCKMNGGIRAGEYQLMRRDSDKYNLFEGDVDDAGTMLAIAKKMGVYTGGGQSWRIEVPGFEMAVRSADELIAHMYEDRDAFWRVRNHLIATHAVNQKMPQYFIDQFYAGL